MKYGCIHKLVLDNRIRICNKSAVHIYFSEITGKMYPLCEHHDAGPICMEARKFKALTPDELAVVEVHEA
jgi:hypothetical protein